MSNIIFPYGAQYYRTPNPPKEDWEHDLRLMKEQGMNTVRLWAMWSWIHTSNDSFDFSHLDRLMELCREIGLNALIQVILENTPAWLVEQNADARYTANDGQQITPMGRPNTPGGGWPGLCLDNSVPREAAQSFMTALAAHFRGHKALLGYDVWNEVWFELDGYIGSQYYCYCQATIEKFRNNLKQSYGDIEGLSKAWYRRYTSWEQVVPPRYWGGYPDWIDWIKFRLANQGELLRWRVQTLREADPDVLLVSHGLPTTIGSTCTHLTDDWRNVKEVDLYGLSCFPLWFNYDNIETFKVHDMIRGASAGKTFWTAETQAGPSGEGLMHSRAPKPEDIRLWNWISLASGGKGVLYWQWRPELLGPESPGFGLCNLDGSPTERTEAASWFAKFTNSHPELLGSKPLKGDAAIVVIPESQIFCHISDRNAGKYAQAVRGAYKALSQAGYQVDFVRPDQLEGYPMVYLPFPLMIEEKTAKVLADYVRNGGVLISEACPAQFGNGGYVQVTTPGYGLHEVFGVKAESGPETVLENAPHIVWNDKSVWCTVHRQQLVVQSAEVLAEYSDGGPAMTRNTFGNGKAVLIGTYPGLCLEWGCEDAGRLIADLAESLGVKPRAAPSDMDVWVRLHESDGRLTAYVVNISLERKEVTVRFSDDINALDSSVDIVTGEKVAAKDNQLTVSVNGHDARVLNLISASITLA